MNYIAEINSFWDSVTTNPLSTGQVSLYFALLHICNRSNWTEWFTVSNQVLSILTGMSRSGILKARNELKQRGIIDFKERGTKATAYKICTMSNSTQDSKQNSVQDSKRNGTQDSKQNGSTLKNINQNETDISLCDNAHAEPVSRFKEFWDIYPKRVNMLIAQGEYNYLLETTAELTEDALIAATRNYAEACKIRHIQERYRKNPENWLKESVWVDYLPENYKKPQENGDEPTRRKNSFNNFSQRQYDYENLEKLLLDSGRGGS